MKQLKVVILGAGSHIAKGLIYNFLKTENVDLHLYTRSPEKVLSFVNSQEKSLATNFVVHENYVNLFASNCDILINCVGVGTANKLDFDFSRWFTVTEEFDNLSLAYLLQNPETLYINFSSGAVYGTFSTPANENTTNNIQINNIQSKDYYSIARINAEAKHRAFSEFKIVDLRIFSYFSRFTDLTDNYFLDEIISAVLNKKVFLTNDINIVRDYIGHHDLFNLILQCYRGGKLNTAFDVISKGQVEKFAIIDYFASQYGLKYEIKKSLDIQSGTGMKNNYYSTYNKALEIGYESEYTSLGTIAEESIFVILRAESP
jgi:hypothetical protein